MPYFGMNRYRGRWNRTKRAFALRPVTSRKLVSNAPNNNVLAGVVTEVIIARGIDPANLADNQVDCATGSRLGRVTFWLTVATDAGAVPSLVNIFFAIYRGGQVFADLPTPVAVGGSQLRNQVFKQDQFGIGTDTSQETVTRRYQFTVPKRLMSRLREGDVLVMSYRCNLATVISTMSIVKCYN